MTKIKTSLSILLRIIEHTLDFQTICFSIDYGLNKQFKYIFSEKHFVEHRKIFYLLVTSLRILKCLQLKNKCQYFIYNPLSSDYKPTKTPLSKIQAHGLVFGVLRYKMYTRLQMKIFETAPVSREG